MWLIYNVMYLLTYHFDNVFLSVSCSLCLSVCLSVCMPVSHLTKSSAKAAACTACFWESWQLDFCFQIWEIWTVGSYTLYINTKRLTFTLLQVCPATCVNYSCVISFVLNRTVVTLTRWQTGHWLRHQLKKMIEREFTYSFVSVKSQTDYVMCSL